MKWLIFSLVLLASGCATKPESVVVVEDKVTVIDPVVKSPSFKSVQWEVYGDKEFLYTLNQREFENLMSNIEEFKRFSLDQKAAINYYKSLNKK